MSCGKNNPNANFELITLTHANHNCELKLYKHQIFGHWYSKEHRATLVMAVGGACVPVLESVDEVTDIISKFNPIKHKETKENG